MAAEIKQHLDQNSALIQGILTTIQSMVVNVDTKMNNLHVEMQQMKAEILDMKGKIDSSKSVLDAVDRKVDCNKAEVVNSIHDKMKKLDKISEVFVKIVASQNTLSSSLKGVARNLPQRDVMMDKHELSQSLAELKQSIQRNKPMHRNEMVGHLKKMKDVVSNLPQKDLMMDKHELSLSLAEIKQSVQTNKPMD